MKEWRTIVVIFLSSNKGKLVSNTAFGVEYINDFILSSSMNTKSAPFVRRNNKCQEESLA